MCGLEPTVEGRAERVSSNRADRELVATRMESPVGPEGELHRGGIFEASFMLSGAAWVVRH